MFFHDTTSDLNKYPMNYNMFADNAMAMAAAPGCNSDMLPTEFIYPNYNLNQYVNSRNRNVRATHINDQLQFSAGQHEMISFTNLRKPSSSSSLHSSLSSSSSSSSLLTSIRTGSSNGLGDLSAGFMAHQQQQHQQPRPRGHHHHHSSISSTSSSTSSIGLDNAYLLSSSSSTPASTSSSLHSYNESSNASFFLTSDTSSSTPSTPPSSSPSPNSSASSIAPTPALISTVTGSSSSASSTSSSAMDYMLTNQNSLLVQPHQQHQQQHYRQHQQIDHRPTARVQGSYPQHNNNMQQQQYVSFPANDFQGVPSSSASSTSSSSAAITPAVIVCSQQGPGTGPQQQYTPWNIDIATSSNPTANAQLQLTSSPFISIPAKSTPTPSAATATTSSVAWTNESEGGGGGQTTHRSKQQQHQQQQQQQQLHIMTSLDSGIASMYPHISGSHHHGLDLSVAASLVSQQQQPPCTTSPAQQAAMSTHFQSQPQYQHHASWGMAATTSSPVESCFNSGSSTPSFASSMSPTLSYSSFELGSSGDSSRAASPSHHNQHQYHHYHHQGTPYDAPSHFERRHRRRDSDASSSLIIRSRKSSTSSTSSNASQRRMSTLRESTLPSTPVSSSNNNNTTTTTTTSVSSPTHQCPTCNLCFAGPAVLVRHIESIHDKLLWNCVGCNSNLSRRDAVTRHINLSPMDSVCRSVGTIGQIKMLNGSEVHYEISSYKAKPLDEVMNRMGKKISAALRQEIDRAKANNAIAAASSATVAAEPVVSTSVAMGAHHHQYQQQHEYGFPDDIMARLRETAVADGMTAAAASGSLLEMDEELMMVGGEYDDEMEYESDGSLKKRRRPFQHTLGQRKK